MCIVKIKCEPLCLSDFVAKYIATKARRHKEIDDENIFVLTAHMPILGIVHLTLLPAISLNKSNLRTIFISIFTLIGSACIAQGDYVPKLNIRKVVWGFQANYFNNFDLNFKSGIGFSTSATVKKQNHAFAIGPMWWVDKNYHVSNFRGGIFSYQYFPNKNSKRINFYFIYDLAYTFEKSGWDKSVQYGNTFYNVSYKTNWHSLKNQIGYGFNVKLYKGLYITQSMSIGIEYYNTGSKTEVKDNPSLSNTYSSGNIFSGSGTSSFLKFGMGYNFEK